MNKAAQLWETIKILGLSNERLALQAIEAALAAQQAPAQPAARFSCYRQRDFGEAPCAEDCGKLRCMYPSAAPAQPPAKVEREGLTDAEFVKCIESAGFTTWDSRMWALKRALEAAHGIAPAHGERKESE